MEFSFNIAEVYFTAGHAQIVILEINHPFNFRLARVVIIKGLIQTEGESRNLFTFERGGSAEKSCIRVTTCPK